MSDFALREVERFGRPIFRLGLSGTFGLDEAGCREALERMQYVFWSPRMRALTAALRDALASDRDRYVVSAGPVFGYFPGALRRAAENALRILGTDHLDVFQLYWLGKMSAFTGAVRDIFPRLHRRHPVVVAYTATAWRKLLRPPRGWKGKVPTAGDCYRFCLSSPYVDIALTGPRSASELRENLAALEKGPFSQREMEEMRAFGRAVHG